MRLSIVITTYNRAAVLRRLLLDLEDQSDRDFQVVVAVDGSTDDTEAMLSKMRLGYDLRWTNTHFGGYGLAIARNRGILTADGDAVTIIDDDSFPQPDFVAAIKRAVRRGTITGGPRIPADPADTRLEWKRQQLDSLPPLSPMMIGQLRRDWPTAYLIENNICLFREDWVDLGLFSERLKMYGFIGQEFFCRAEYFGYKYQYCPDAAIVHHAEFEGDNGLPRTKKSRQARIAAAIRPALTTPRHFDAQREWARQADSGNPGDTQLPPFWIQAGMAFPFRLLHLETSFARKRLRSLLRFG